MEPEELTYQLLREITDDFWEKLKVGEGAFGAVYKVRFGHAFVVKSLTKTRHCSPSKQPTCLPHQSPEMLVLCKVGNMLC